MSTEPCASSTAGDVKFSDAISWIVVFWRSPSRRMMSAISRVGLAQGGRRVVIGGCRSSCSMRGDLLEPALRAGRPRTAWRARSRGSPRPARGRRSGRRSRARWRRCAAGHARRVEVVAERGADAVHLVRRDLLALAAAAEHDAALGLAADDRRADGRAVRRVVDRLGAVGPEIDRPRGPTASSTSTRCGFSGSPRGRRRSRSARTRVYRPGTGRFGARSGLMRGLAPATAASERRS